MARPEIGGVPNYYPWAASDVVEAVIIDGETLYLNNKVEPLTEHTNFGLRYDEPITNAEFNYILQGASEWYQYVDSLHAIGDVKHTTTSETATTFSGRMGGTWVLVDTVTIGTDSVKVFKKTAD